MTISPIRMLENVNCFIEGQEFLDVTDFSACTRGGGGQGRIEQDIATLCPQSKVLSCLEIYGSGSRNALANVSAWLRTIGITP